jgi:hypothetical protein
MKQLVLPLLCCGNLDYFSSLVSHESIVLDDLEMYPKQTYRNRYRILGANGPLELSLPVKSTNGIKTPVQEIALSFDEPWPEQHWKTLVSAYGSSPFFQEYSVELKPLLLEPEPMLFKHNLRLLNWILRTLDLNVQIEFKSLLPDIPNKDPLQQAFKPSKEISNTSIPYYPQVFEYKFGFVPQLSILDALFNTGTETIELL